MRAARIIALQDSVWFVLVTLLVGGALIAAAPRVTHDGRPWVPSAVTILLAALLETSRSDARLVALMGGHFAVVKFVDATLWLSPVLLWVTVQEPADGLTAVLGIALVSLAPAWRTSGSKRTYRPRTRLVALGVVEWIAGLRRAPWVFGGATLVGALGPPHPLLALASMAVSTLAVTAYHWTPSEGWMIIDAANRRPRSFLWHKVGTSSALLACALIAIVASALIRGPSYPAVFAFAAVVCLHAHACGVLCRYAAYQQGVPLSTVGWLTWFLSASLIAFPPAGLIALFMLERRAVRSLTPYCRPTAAWHR